MTIRSTNIQVVGELFEGFEEILTPDALQFIEQLELRFGSNRKELLREDIKDKRKLIMEYSQISKGNGIDS